MQEGYILQMDEVDAMQPEVGFILQQILEPHGHLLLTDTSEDIAPHADFRPVATANTLSFGSDSGLYATRTLRSFDQVLFAVFSLHTVPLADPQEGVNYMRLSDRTWQAPTATVPV